MGVVIIMVAVVAVVDAIPTLIFLSAMEDMDITMEDAVITMEDAAIIAEDAAIVKMDFTACIKCSKNDGLSTHQ